MIAFLVFKFDFAQSSGQDNEDEFMDAMDFDNVAHLVIVNLRKR